MTKYELSLYDFESIKVALDAGIRRTKILLDDVRLAMGDKDKVYEVMAERLSRMEMLRDKFERAHTGWLEFE